MSFEHSGAVSPMMVMISLEDNEPTAESRLQSLAQDITAEIHLMSVSSKLAIQLDLQRIRETSQRRPFPIVEHCYQLFRYYAQTATDMKDRVTSNAVQNLTEPAEVQAAEKTERLSGLRALRSPMFWYRGLTIVLTLISFVVMSCVPDITLAKVRFSNIFDTAHCFNNFNGMRVKHGRFDFRCYELVLVASVLIYAYNSCVLLYYLLPVDGNNDKFVPGLRYLLTHCFSVHTADSIMHRAAVLLKSAGLAGAAFFDVAFAVLALTGALAAAIVLGENVAFILTCNTSQTIYFTLDTFYNTFSHESSVCLEFNPVPLIRASIAMLFLSLLPQGKYIQITILRLLEDLRSRSNDSGVNSQPLPQEDSLEASPIATEDSNHA